MSALVGGAPVGAPPAAADAFKLAGHVRSATLENHTVLLDLRRDKYLCVCAAALSEVLAGEAGEEDALRRALVRDGLLMPAGAAETFAAERRLALGWLRGTTPVAFLYSCLWARHVIRARALERALVALSTLRDSDQDAAAAASRFFSWRPWYPARSVCLFDSLALARFLAASRARFELVFGVRTAPFAAHCWIEAQGGVLNDEAHYCGAFTEIMRV